MLIFSCCLYSETGTDVTSVSSSTDVSLFYVAKIISPKMINGAATLSQAVMVPRFAIL